MGHSYSNMSKLRLSTCHSDIQLVFNRVIEVSEVDVSIIVGHRNYAEQKRAFIIGNSQKDWPDSKHNREPSEAVDAAPYVFGKASEDTGYCCYLAGIVLATAACLGIAMRWGGNWDRDGIIITDQQLRDLWHYELI